MSKPILRALPIHRMGESRVRPAVVALLRTIMPVYLRAALRFRSVRLLCADSAVESVRSFQDGKSRLIICFRHPYGDEPQLIANIVARAIPAAARRAGRPLRKPSHAHFVYGYEVPLWSDALTRWIIQRIGAVPVYHVKINSVSVERLRLLMRDGPYPLALAPEGQASYVSEFLPRLESGFAHLALGCADALAKADRPETVLVLPLSVHYRYGRDAPRALAKLIASMEKGCGLAPAAGHGASLGTGTVAVGSFARLRRIAEAIVAEAEGFYRELDGGKSAAAPNEAAPNNSATAGSPNGEIELKRRWAVVLESALTVGERALRLKPEGDFIQRVYRLRQTGWDRIYRADLPPPRDERPAPPPLRRSLWDREAAEAWYAMRHMELADLGFYIDFAALKADDPVERYLETANNYRDLISRLRGGNISDRGNPARKQAIVVAGEPLLASAAGPADGGPVGGGRGDRKAAIIDLTKRLEQSFLACIDTYQEKYRQRGQ